MTAAPQSDLNVPVVAERSGLVAALAKRSGVAELAADLGHISAFAFEVIGNRAAQIGVGDVMGGVGGLRQVSARQLVLALRAGLDHPQAALDREINRLVIADLEMQERMMLDRAPIAAEQRIGADKIDRARDPATVPLGHYQQHVLAHGLAD